MGLCPRPFVAACDARLPSPALGGYRDAPPAGAACTPRRPMTPRSLRTTSLFASVRAMSTGIIVPSDAAGVAPSVSTRPAAMIASASAWSCSGPRSGEHAPCRRSIRQCVRHHHPCLMVSPSSIGSRTAADVSQSTSSTLLYFASNGLRLSATVRSMSFSASARSP
jgi:hypothetical protein